MFAKHKLILAVVGLLLSSQAQAAKLWPDPPKKYDHPYAGKIYVFQNLTPFAVGAFWPTYGYTFVIPGTRTCIIQVWKPYYNNSLYRHERAHCNSWPWWHPTT